MFYINFYCCSLMTGGSLSIPQVVCCVYPNYHRQLGATLPDKTDTQPCIERCQRKTIKKHVLSFYKIPLNILFTLLL